MSTGGDGATREATIGRYRLGEVIGVGSFATVHRALDERLDDVVVVKVLAENHSLNPEIRERFIAEGRALRKVRSPHVVTVHDIGESTRQQPFLVLEHADRGTLTDRVKALRQQGWVASSADALSLARPLAGALEAVHEAQLVHRDLSPTNVLLTTDETAETDSVPSAELVRPDERVVVADLGMCKDLALNSGLTVAGGTAGFRPPEMDGGPSVIDIRADLWSLSSLFDWLVEGADLPHALHDALARSLAPDPQDRHPDARAWLTEVEQALAPPEHVGDGEGGPVGRHTGSGAGASSRRWLPLLLAAALLLGLGGGWLLGRTTDPPAATQSSRVEIEGPDEVTVGESASFTLRHLGVNSWVWVLPTGQHVADQESVTLSPTGTGRSQVSLLSRDTDGTELRTTHRFTVTE
ncbi:serine/threonine-protein kinase [Ornithinimicrobium sp. Y1694]|uniref:serine/threonine-protein kinase n=1 Tax=Ornithinimicrobium sp. Y1694 TaxID=3418590 RepID=UPI003CF25DBE